jgi:hypothetical protein
MENQEPKQYSSRILWAEYLALSDTEKVKLLNDAILFMQEANYRTKAECIFMAMGYKKLIDNIFIEHHN